MVVRSLVVGEDSLVVEEIDLAVVRRSSLVQRRLAFELDMVVVAILDLAADLVVDSLAALAVVVEDIRMVLADMVVDLVVVRNLCRTTCSVISADYGVET